MRFLLGPVYVEGRRVQFWYLDYDPTTACARLGYELVGMPDRHTREPLGETWYPFEEARPFMPPLLWDEARNQLAHLQQP